MKVSDLVRELNLTVFCGEAGLDAEISGGYTSDLLSDVMGHIDEGMLWVTMQPHLSGWRRPRCSGASAS